MRYIYLSHGQSSSFTGQFEFNSCIDNKRKKYVNQLSSLVDWHPLNNGAIPYDVYLYLELKFEYKSSGGRWYPEVNIPRWLDWDITADIISKDKRDNVTTLSQTYTGTALVSGTVHQVFLMEDSKERTVTSGGKWLA